MNDLHQLKYPIGEYQKPNNITDELIDQWVDVLSLFPERLKKEVVHLTDEQLDTTYRENGWTIRQVVNHCADSHSNSLTRFKLALTEDVPVIKPYFEDRWAELVDSKTIPITPALLMLEGLHARWVALLKSLTRKDLERKFFHPEHNKEFSLDEWVGFYAWHCNHHLTHITKLKERRNWE